MTLSEEFKALDCKKLKYSTFFLCSPLVTFFIKIYCTINNKSRRIELNTVIGKKEQTFQVGVGPYAKIRLKRFYLSGTRHLIFNQLTHSAHVGHGRPAHIYSHIHSPVRLHGHREWLTSHPPF